MTENTAAKRPKKIMFLMPKDTPKIFPPPKMGIYGGIYNRLVFMQATATGMFPFGRDGKHKHKYLPPYCVGASKKSMCICPFVRPSGPVFGHLCD